MSTLKVNELSTVPGSGDINFAPGTGINLSGASQVVIPADSTSNRPGSPTEGSIRVNTTNYKLEFYTGATGWKQVDAEPSQVTLTAQSGTWSVPDGITSVDVLLVGGGGSGGSGTGGGGGGGAMVQVTSFPVTPGTSVPYGVGNGGSSPGTNGGYGYQGGNTTFGTLVAYGGGGGGSSHPGRQGAGRPGGCGGGGAIYPTGSFPAGNSSQPGAPGFSASNGSGNPGEPGNFGGGGGVGAAGGASFGQNTGGAGITTDFAGAPLSVGGGGRGQAQYPNPGPAPGSGGGGGCQGSQGVDGGSGVGGGGGSGWDYGSGNGGAGGSGTLVIKYT